MTNMTITTANTHELKSGDVVMNYGVYFLLLDRKTYPMRADDCPVLQGECVTFTTKCVGSTVSGDVFPMSWRKDFTIQGNKMATWAVIGAEQDAMTQDEIKSTLSDYDEHLARKAEVAARSKR